MYSVIPVPPDQAIVLPLRSRIALRVALDLRTREDALSLRGARCYFFPMSTLVEIEKSVSQFSANELAELKEGSLSIHVPAFRKGTARFTSRPSGKARRKFPCANSVGTVKAILTVRGNNGCKMISPL